MKGGKDGWRHAVLKAAGGLEGKGFHASTGLKDVPATLTHHILPKNKTNSRSVTWWLRMCTTNLILRATTLSATLLKQQHNLVPTAGWQQENESDTSACHVSVEHAAQANTPTNWTDLWLPTLSCWVGTATAEGGEMDKSVEKLFLNQFVVHSALFLFNSDFHFGYLNLLFLGFSNN